MPATGIATSHGRPPNVATVPLVQYTVPPKWTTPVISPRRNPRVVETPGREARPVHPDKRHIERRQGDERNRGMTVTRKRECQ